MNGFLPELFPKNPPDTADYQFREELVNHIRGIFILEDQEKLPKRRPDIIYRPKQYSL